MSKKIYACGLGPGDYEMMSLKAKRVLEESDVIFLSGGKVFNGHEGVKALLDNIGCGDKLKFYEYPDNQSMRHKHIEEFVAETIKYYNQGMQVSYVTMGDLTIYSSFPDIYNELKKHNIELEAVTGISSFFAPASKTGQNIVDFQDKAAIIPNPKDYMEIKNLLETFTTIIIMKVGDNGNAIKEFVEKCSPSYAVTVFNAYMENEKIYDLLKEHPYGKEDFYMSVTMIKR